MKKTIFSFLLTLLFFFHTYSQSAPLITIQSSSIEVGDLLREISKQASIDFSFNSKIIDKRTTLDFNIQNATLEETLDLLSKKINISYQIIEGQVVLNFAKPKIPQEQYFTLSGFLSEQATGEVLIGASVLLNGTARGTVTNEFGYYALRLKKGIYELTFSYIGFEAQTLKLEVQKDVRQDIALEIESINLVPVIVGLTLEEEFKQKQLDALRFSPEQLNSLPEFGGESGLVKGIQSLPGISIHSDGSAFFNVRGGERDQNVIFIDDAPIFGASHLLGFYSMIIPDFTKSIDIYKSDMPVSLGDRLSSIISIRTNDGNLNKLQFSGAINPFINRFTLETPIVKQKSAAFISFRRSNFDRFLERAETGVQYYFQDFHFKWNWQINDKNRFFLTAIQAGDVFEGRGDFSNISWGSGAASIRWNHLFNPRLFSNTTLYTGNYSYTVNAQPNFWKSELGMIGLKTDFTHYASPKYQAKFGFDFQTYSNTPGGFTTDSTINILPSFSNNLSRKSVLYYQGTYDFAEKWQFKGGLRMTTWANLGPRTFYTLGDNYEVSDTLNAGFGAFHRYFQLDPRLSLSYQLNRTAQLKLSYGVYRQYLQLILDSVSPFSTLEVWLPASPNIRPQKSTHLALNYLKYYEASKMELALAAYYKNAKHQIDYKAHATTFLNPLLEAELRFGDAQSFGLEFLLKKNFGKVNGWLSYTFSRTFRTTKDLNNDLPYRAVQDRPHEFSLALNFPLAKRILGSTYWTSSNGNTFSSPIGFYDFNEQSIPIYGERNNDRLPTYHRLDFSIKFLLNKKPEARYQHNVTFSMYNALGHPNIFAIKFNKLESNQFSPAVPSNVLSNALLSPSQIDLLRFFPSLTYKFKI